MSHIPVLLHETIDILNPQAGEFFIDGTLGEGGHAVEILKRIAGGKFLGVDWDRGAIEKFAGKEKEFGEVEIVLENDNYANLSGILKRRKLDQADGLLIDLGFSSEQLETQRGFSFERENESLLMTYSDTQTPLYKVLEDLDAETLEKILRELSDERYAMSIAQAVVEREKQKSIRKVGELTEVIRSVVPKNYERGRINPATRTFMALRMYVNEELGNIEKLLASLKDIIKPGGRVAIISFHSKEDRLIKEYFKRLKDEDGAEILTKHVIKPAWEEVKTNPRSRSAKLRVIKIK